MKKTLIVMAAGLGSRFGGLKQLSKFGEKQLALVDYAIIDAIDAGFEKIIFVVRDDIIELFKEEVSAKYENKIKIEHVCQRINSLPENFKAPANREKPWGTAQAVLTCKDAIEGSFLVINADDYYGKSSYKLATKFMDESISKDVCGLIAYRLKNTLSSVGGVSRGVCETDENGFLKDIKETFELMQKGNHIEDKDGKKYFGEELVSMNFWCFAPEFMEILEKYFIDFLKKNSDNLKAECYLPYAVDWAVKCNIMKAKVLCADEIWKGVTYAEDKPEVESFLKATR